MLEISRADIAWADLTRAYKILIDDVEVGEIRKGEVKRFDLDDGFHSLKLKIDWCSSQEIIFKMENGATVYAECSPSKKPFIIGELLYITFLKGRYIDLSIKEKI